MSSKPILAIPLEGGLIRGDPNSELRLRRVLSRGGPGPAFDELAVAQDTLLRLRTAQQEGRRVALLSRLPSAGAIAEEIGGIETVAEDPDALAQAFPDAQIERVEPTPPAARLSALLRALRPYQWVKNLLIFLPLLAAHDISSLGAAIAAFAAFSLTASSVYVLNDIADLSADRAHPRKCRRPFASGALTVAEGLRLAAGLVIGALALSVLFTPTTFLAVLGAYYVTTFAYSLWFKRKLIIDVMALAMLYTVRIAAGAVATATILSPWMLGFSMFMFLSLAAVKRQAELTDMVARGADAIAGRAYRADDLPVVRSMALSSGYAAVLVFALYVTSDDVTALYARPEILWAVCPLLLYWITRMVMKTHRGRMDDDPIVFAAKDLVSVGVAVLCAITFLSAGAL
ncbi:MAG: UbiA family prenyltransferase [Pseudomonadota bacterium]